MSLCPQRNTINYSLIFYSAARTLYIVPMFFLMKNASCNEIKKRCLSRSPTDAVSELLEIVSELLSLPK
jgi:hypothetical protein